MKRLIVTLTALLVACAVSLQAQVRKDDFKIKAMHVDFRAEVMTLEGLKDMARWASAQGLNAIIMEWEASFPFDKHATICNSYAFTADEVREFVSYCATLGIDVIPLQNCIGHCEYILRHDRYADLRESSKDPSQVCPLEIEKARSVFKEIFAEVAALHPSKYFHIGADEAYLLGQCPDCAEFAATQGKSRLFVNYVKEMAQIVIDMGKTPIMWADVIMKHPDAIGDIPKEAVFVYWNYGNYAWDVNKLQVLHNAGVEIWGATAMRSNPDNVYLTQWAKHFNNLATFVPFARESGYAGMIQTSWSTGGTYRFHFDQNNEIINMQPIRLVYPQAGFNILIAATGKAYSQTEPFEPEKFVKEYAHDKYGFDAKEAQVLWDYFQMPQEVVFVHTGKDKRGVPIGEVRAECEAMRDRLGELTPKANDKEFEHYKLMLDLRINYLKYKEIEVAYESSSFSRSQAPELIKRLETVMKESDELGKRFVDMNRGYLRDGELRYVDGMRTEKMKWLYRCLTNDRS